MACEEVFTEKLRERGLRLTPQREMILSAMHRMEGLATAEEIYAHVHQVNSAVDVSTVYRTLDLLQELGIVACIERRDTQNVYELVGVHGPHIHLVCQSCDHVIGIDLQEARSLADRLWIQHGFAADLDHLTIPGLCQTCVQESA